MEILDILLVCESKMAERISTYNLDFKFCA